MVLAAAVALHGCGASAPPFFCPSEALRASLRTALLPGEDAATDVLVGNFEARRDENIELDAVEGAIEGRTLGRGISIWVQRGFNRPLSVSVRVPTPLRPGDVFRVRAVHRIDNPFWGTVAGLTEGASVGVLLETTAATAAEGEVRVVNIDPLRLELDFVATAGGRALPIRGPLEVRHETFNDSCFE